ncbi:hypothetical protein SPRA44_350084 [Serratia proteamaculans]|nr:hypothetical protein SPRA44_350084 [Serratia proteamaculans]
MSLCNDLYAPADGAINLLYAAIARFD